MTGSRRLSSGRSELTGLTDWPFGDRGGILVTRCDFRFRFDLILRSDAEMKEREVPQLRWMDFFRTGNRFR